MPNLSRPAPPFALLAAGLAVGVLGWLAAQAVSGRFEPYDSGAGLLANQLVLSVPAVALAVRARPSASLLCLSGAYVGMNAAAYAFGGSEARAWALLGAVTSLSLMIVPVTLCLVLFAARGASRARK